MTLTDAGPLIALFDTKQEAHARCQQVIQDPMRFPLLTAWPCIAEAMYFLGQKEGWRKQELLARMVTQGTLRIVHQGRRDQARILALMEQYQDTPMDLADASLVALAERLGLGTVFTLDSHFYAYRLADGGSLAVIPPARP